MAGPGTDNDRAKFEHVPLTNALLYGVSAVPLSMVGTCLALYLVFFYTKTLGMGPLYVSAVLFIGSLWDAVSDQIMGQISDRTPWKAGRRRPYFLIGAIPFGLSFYLIMAPPPGVSGLTLFVYLFFFRILLYTAATVIYVPLYALTPEMSQTYHGRTRLTAWREAFGNVGDFIGMIAVPVIAIIFFSDGDGRGQYTTVGAIGLVLSILCMVACYAGSYEDPTFHAPQTIDWMAGVRAMRDSLPFRTLILATMFPGIAIQMTAGLFLFLISDVLQVDNDMFTIMAFAAYVGASILSYPLWTAYARRFGKAVGYRTAISMMALAYLGVYALQEGTMWRMYPIMAFAGAGNAGFWTAMFSQLADIADLDELETGSRREGLFAGFAALMRKVGYAFGGGFIGVGLWAVGFDQDAEVQTAAATFGLKLVFSIPTCLFALIGLWVFRRYAVDEKLHADVVRQLEERKAAQVSAPMQAGGG